MRYNEFLMRINKDELAKVKQRVVDETEFRILLRYLQFNIPYDELRKLIDYGPFSKKIREFDPVKEIFDGAKLADPILKSYTSNFEQVLKHGYSFVFFGANGSGKSMSGIYILCKAVEDGRTVYYIDFKKLMQVYNEGMFMSERDANQLLKHIYNCDVLMVDELGKESSTTPNVVGALEALIKTRASFNKATIIGTNADFSKRQFQEKYGNSVFNALFEKYRILQFASEGNFRAKMREQWVL